MLPLELLTVVATTAVFLLPSPPAFEASAAVLKATPGKLEVRRISPALEPTDATTSIAAADLLMASIRPSRAPERVIPALICESVILNVTFGDAYEYNYYVWNTSDNRDDLNKDGEIGKDDFQIVLEENREFLEQMGQTIEPGDAFLGVSGLVSSTHGIDGLVGPFAPDSSGTLMEKIILTPFHVIQLLFQPFENKGTAMNPFEESMLAADSNGLVGILGTSNMILIVEFCFWLIWVNILLGLTNLIPILPFDGGHLFKDMMHGTIEKINRLREILGFKKWHPLSIENLVGKISGWSSLGLFLILFIMFLLPYFV